MGKKKHTGAGVYCGVVLEASVKTDLSMSHLLTVDFHNLHIYL